jgi:branched-subunit amino acid ABC-type transport system permease component
VIVLSFAVVVIGGLGSLPGAALGAVIVGVVRSLSVHYLPQVELFVIYFVMAMVLALRRAACSASPSRGRYERDRRRCGSSFCLRSRACGCRNGRCSS